MDKTDCATVSGVGLDDLSVKASAGGALADEHAQSHGLKLLTAHYLESKEGVEKNGAYHLGWKNFLCFALNFGDLEKFLFPNPIFSQISGSPNPKTLTGTYFELQPGVCRFAPPSFEFGYIVVKAAAGHFQNGFEVKEKVCLTEFSYFDRGKQPVEKRIPYSHTSAETNKFLIYPVTSFRMNYEKFVAQDFSNGFFGIFDFDRKIPFSFMVFEAATGKFITKCVAENSAMAFHLVNASLLMILGRTKSLWISRGR